MADVTRWLNASTTSRDEEMFAALYAELHKIARGRMAGECQGQTLEATGLVHEAWLRLEKSAPAEWRDRQAVLRGGCGGHAADSGRGGATAVLRPNVGGGDEAVVLEDDLPVPAPMADERLLGVHEVLDQLEEENELNAHIVKMRFFAGMTNDEIASLLDVSATTIKRRWVIAKVWLYEALSGEL